MDCGWEKYAIFIRGKTITRSTKQGPLLRHINQNRRYFRCNAGWPLSLRDFWGHIGISVVFTIHFYFLLFLYRNTRKRHWLKFKSCYSNFKHRKVLFIWKRFSISTTVTKVVTVQINDLRIKLRNSLNAQVTRLYTSFALYNFIHSYIQYPPHSRS